MGYVIAMGECFGCRRLFSFNPELVPSITPPGRTEREPICQACVDRANPMRAKNGLPPIEVRRGAYEPAPEHPDDEEAFEL
jgi:hypothetical protein